MTFFIIFRSPLIFGGDLPSLDSFTKSLLTNKNVLKIHRDSSNVHYVSNDNRKVILQSKNKKTDETYLAILNVSNNSNEILIPLKSSDLHIDKFNSVRSAWSGKSLSFKPNEVSVSLKDHASILSVIK